MKKENKIAKLYNNSSMKKTKRKKIVLKKKSNHKKKQSKTMKKKSNNKKKQLKGGEKFNYTDEEIFCKKFTKTPPVNIEKVIYKNGDFFYKKGKNEILLYEAKVLGKGGGGKVYLLVDKNNEIKIALKEIKKRFRNDTLVENKEISIIKEIKEKKIPCELIQVKLFEDIDNWYVIMPVYENDLIQLIGKLNPFELINLAIELGSIYECLIKNGLYYTDSKPEQILYKCISDNTFSITLADLGSIGHKNDMQSIQSFPFPPKTGYKDFYEDREYTSEKVVVWGFVITLLTMVNSNTDNLVYELLSWKDLQISEQYNSYETFLIEVREHIFGTPLYHFFKTFLGMDKSIYDMVDDNEYTMKNVMKYLRETPFYIIQNIYNMPERNLFQMEKMSAKCADLKKVITDKMNADVYSVYMNGYIIAYGVFDIDKSIIWDLCIKEKYKTKNYIEKIIQGICHSDKTLHIYVKNTEEQLKMLKKIGFQPSKKDNEKYEKYNIIKMTKECK